MNHKELYRDIEKWRADCRGQKRRYYGRTSGIYPVRPYTQEEDQKILAHEIPDTRLSEEIKRSVRAIQIRRSRLKKQKKETW